MGHDDDLLPLAEALVFSRMSEEMSKATQTLLAREQERRDRRDQAAWRRLLVEVGHGE